MRKVVLWCLCLLVRWSSCSGDHAARIKRAAPSKVFNAKWNATNADQLKRDLMLNYDKFTRPTQDENSTVVTFDPRIYHIELDEEKAIMTVYCWVKMTWTDEKLKWVENDYGGVSALHLADHEIWQPDLIPYNSATGSAIDNFGNTHAVVSSDGGVTWAPPAILRVFCDIDLRKWPFDTQVCSVKIGSWTYSGEEISLKYVDEKVDFSNLLENPEWKFVGLTRKRNVVHYECCPEPYVDLEFKLTVSRESPTYRALIFTPITAIVLMTLATFWLPAASTEKITLGGSTTLIIAVFLVYFTQKLAVMAGHTPYIVSFYVLSLYLVAFSIVVSVVVINLATNPRPAPIPWIIKTHLSGQLGRVLLLQDIAAQALPLRDSLPKPISDDDCADNQPVFSEEGNDISEGRGKAEGMERDWLLLATALDRVAFLIYGVLFICFALAFLT